MSTLYDEIMETLARWDADERSAEVAGDEVRRRAVASCIMDLDEVLYAHEEQVRRSADAGPYDQDNPPTSPLRVRVVWHNNMFAAEHGDMVVTFDPLLMNLRYPIMGITLAAVVDRLASATPMVWAFFGTRERPMLFHLPSGDGTFPRDCEVIDHIEVVGR